MLDPAGGPPPRPQGPWDPCGLMGGRQAGRRGAPIYCGLIPLAPGASPPSGEGVTRLACYGGVVL